MRTSRTLVLNAVPLTIAMGDSILENSNTRFMTCRNIPLSSVDRRALVQNLSFELWVLRFELWAFCNPELSPQVGLAVPLEIISTAYCIWSVISSISDLNRWSGCLGLLYYVPLKRDQGDWDWRLRSYDTPNATGCTRFLFASIHFAGTYIYICTFIPASLKWPPRAREKAHPFPPTCSLLLPW